MFIGLWIYQNQPVKKISLLGIIADMKKYKAKKKRRALLEKAQKFQHVF